MARYPRFFFCNGLNEELGLLLLHEMFFFEILLASAIVLEKILKFSMKSERISIGKIGTQINSLDKIPFCSKILIAHWRSVQDRT